jgi:ATP synthase protein I
MTGNPTGPRPEKDMSAYAFALGLGSQLLGALAACGVPGWYLDKKFGTSPWLTLVGVLLGITLGLFQLVRAGTSRNNGGTKHS